MVAYGHGARPGTYFRFGVLANGAASVSYTHLPAEWRAKKLNNNFALSIEGGDFVAHASSCLLYTSCQAWCLYYGEVGELAAKMDGKTRWALMVPQVE